MNSPTWNLNDLSSYLRITSFESNKLLSAPSLPRSRVQKLFYSRSIEFRENRKFFILKILLMTFYKIWFLISLAIDVIKVIIITEYLGRLIRSSYESVFWLKKDEFIYQIIRIKFYFLAILFYILSTIVLLKF